MTANRPTRIALTPDEPPLSLAEAVECGAALLDERWPGWELVIDSGPLRMESSEHCILGQLFGNYIVGLNVLSATDELDFDITHGFDVEVPHGAAAAFAELGRLWRAQIRARGGVA